MAARVGVLRYYRYKYRAIWKVSLLGRSMFVPCVKVWARRPCSLAIANAPKGNGRVLHRAGAQTTPNFREKIDFFFQNDFESFSAADTRTAVLVSTAKAWISAPET